MNERYGIFPKETRIGANPFKRMRTEALFDGHDIHIAESPTPAQKHPATTTDPEQFILAWIPIWMGHCNHSA